MELDQVSMKILIVDDVPANIGLLSNALEPEGYEILVAPGGEVALKVAQHSLPDLIILDILMPDMDGFEVCHLLKENEDTKDIPVIFVTAKDQTDAVVKGFQIGGVDYITKPFENEIVLARVRNHLKISRLTRELFERNRALKQEIARRKQAEDAREQAESFRKKADDRLSMISEQEVKRWGIDGFVGKSITIGEILENIRRLHNTSTMSILITGESGTGKELIARAIHFGGARSAGPFIAVNCSAVPEDLAESLFFGHIKGAFTGATSSRAGFFEQADGGTLFLDEIGDMSTSMQAKLLRVIEDGTIVPIGSQRQNHVDVRIIAATNTDLEAEMQDGKFRDDLYFRIASFTVSVPPLRERSEDIPLLVNHFLNLFSADMGIQPPELSEDAFDALMSYDFPGNIRELKHIIEGALIRSGGMTIHPEHLYFLHNSGISVAVKSSADHKAEATTTPEIDRLLKRMAIDGESFWAVVYEPFMNRELSRSQVKSIIKSGLRQVWGSYKSLLSIYNLPESDYQKFMDFLRHHDLKPTFE